MAKRHIVVGINAQDRDMGGYVFELQRAMHHLMIVVPITIGAIFFLLCLLFRKINRLRRAARSSCAELHDHVGDTFPWHGITPAFLRQLHLTLTQGIVDSESHHYASMHKYATREEWLIR
jgi:hypothetical protein